MIALSIFQSDLSDFKGKLRSLTYPLYKGKLRVYYLILWTIKTSTTAKKCTLSRIFQKIEIIMKYVLGMLNDAIKLMICCHVATLEGTTQLWRKKIKAQGFEIIG